MKTQYAALPYRFGASGKLEIMVMTSRRSHRWIIPKGWPVKGLSPERTAEREAFEEAGIIGKVDSNPIGRFYYRKLVEKADRVIDCEVTVFPMRVSDQLSTWPEAGQREVQWLPANAAAALVDDVGLGEIIDHAPGRLCNGRLFRADRKAMRMSAPPGAERASDRLSRIAATVVKSVFLVMISGNLLLHVLGEALSNALWKRDSREQ